MGGVTSVMPGNISASVQKWDADALERLHERLEEFRSGGQNWMTRPQFFELTSDDSKILKGRFLDINIEGAHEHEEMEVRSDLLTTRPQ